MSMIGFTYTSVAEDTAAPIVAVPLDYDFTPHAPCKVLGLLVVSSKACAAENLTLVLDSGQGAAYDGTLYTKDMTGLTQWAVYFDNTVLLDAGDVLTIAQANASNATLSVRIWWEKF
jgi:hypothetical protein